MTAVHGSKASFWIGTVAAAQTPIDVSTFANSVGATFNRDTAETTTLKKNSKTYIPGLKDATVPYEGPWDSVADPTFWDLYDQGTIVLFEYYPAGKAVTGTPKYSGQCFIVSYELNSDVSDAGTMSGEFQVTGDVARVVQ